MNVDNGSEVKLRIAVVGAGAIGGLIAGRLSLTGQSVSLLARGQTLKVLRISGLSIEDAQTGQRSASNPVVFETAAEAGAQDFVILAVKSYGLADAIKSLQPMLGEHTKVVTAVNGIPWWFTAGLGRSELSLVSLDPDQALMRAAPVQRIIGCVVNCAASVPRPGVVRHAGGNRLTLGSPLREDESATRVLATALRDAGFVTSVSDFIHREHWKKLLGNITLNTIGALALSDTRQMLNDTDVVELVQQSMREVDALGKAIGIDIQKAVSNLPCWST